MQKGLEPGADFFDDGSSGSEWEDDEGDMTQTLPDADGLGLRSLLPGIVKQTDNASRGRSRRRSCMTALPQYKQPPARHSGVNTEEDTLSSPVDANGGRRARPVSLKRLSKDNVRVVHNHSRGGTPRNSIRSSTSITSETFADTPKTAPETSGAHVGISKEDSVLGRHRRNTSESILAGSIIDAHFETMRALESLNLSPSSILVNSNSQLFPKRPSFTDERHIKLSPLAMKGVEDRDRPAHLPAHFVRTPYPFSTKKEFPKPKNRPRAHGASDRPYSGETDGFIRLDSGYGEDLEKKEYDDRKGKHVLGLMPSEGEYDLRSRLERNEDAQGIIRSRAGSGREGGESAVWLSLERRPWGKSRHAQQPRKLVKVTVPSSLTTSSPDPEKKKGSSDTVDFDDAFLAERMRAGHRELAGNWFKRTFSARTLRHISLGQVNTWSGAQPQAPNSATSGLLAAGAGLDIEADARSPFTENSLLKLYGTPKSGKARYTWVHWVRRVTASNTSQMPGRRDGVDPSLPDSLTTIQFIHTLSVPRILSALSLMLALSIAAALLWIFLGPGGTGWRTAVDRQRSERVGSGMGVGVLVLLVEGVGFGGWVWCS